MFWFARASVDAMWQPDAMWLLLWVLQAGGHFIGTIPDGKRVLWHLAGRRVYDSPMLRLEKRWEVRAVAQ